MKLKTGQIRWRWVRVKKKGGGGILWLSRQVVTSWPVNRPYLPSSMECSLTKISPSAPPPHWLTATAPDSHSELQSADKLTPTTTTRLSSLVSSKSGGGGGGVGVRRGAPPTGHISTPTYTVSRDHGGPLTVSG